MAALILTWFKQVRVIDIDRLGAAFKVVLCLLLLGLDCPLELFIESANIDCTLVNQKLSLRLIRDLPELPLCFGLLDGDLDSDIPLVEGQLFA